MPGSPCYLECMCRTGVFRASLGDGLQWSRSGAACAPGLGHEVPSVWRRR